MLSYGAAALHAMMEFGEMAAAWAIPASALLLFLYPLALLACTAAEGMAAEDHRARAAAIEDEGGSSPKKWRFSADRVEPRPPSAPSRLIGTVVVVGAALAVATAIPAFPASVSFQPAPTYFASVATVPPAPAGIGVTGAREVPSSVTWLLFCIMPLVFLGFVLMRSVGKSDPIASVAHTRDADGEQFQLPARPRETLVLVMVGLPARGKSHISESVIRHLGLLGVHTRVFNAGALRRQSGGAGAGADFFDAKNKEAKQARDHLAMESLSALLAWLEEDVPRNASAVAILDATNTTKARRQAVLERCSNEFGGGQLHVVFLESICDDPDILQANYDKKLSNDDYRGCSDPRAALADFSARVVAYESQYEPLNDAELQGMARGAIETVGAMRVVNGGQRIEMSMLVGSWVTWSIGSMLQSMHLESRSIFLARESALETWTAQSIAARAAELTDASGTQRPPFLLCQDPASPGALRLVSALEGEGGVEVLATRELAPRWRRDVVSLWRRLFYGPGNQPSETFEDLARRLREILLFVEGARRAVVIVCADDDVLRVFWAHFRGGPEGERAAEFAKSVAPVFELRRGCTGGASARAAL